MKKCIVFILNILICLFLLVACKSTGLSVLPSFTPDTAAESIASASEDVGKTIAPLASSIDINDLDNCSVAAGFEAKDVYLENGSRLVIHFTVYDLELFDENDISELKKGDTLAIGGEFILIDSVEMDNDGVISINGGLKKGGKWLATSDTGTYYEICENESRVYSVVGEIIIPVAQEFIFRDAIDNTAVEKKSYAGDFIMDMTDSDRMFSPNTTTVTITDGKITELTAVYDSGR